MHRRRTVSGWLPLLRPWFLTLLPGVAATGLLLPAGRHNPAPMALWIVFWPTPIVLSRLLLNRVWCAVYPVAGRWSAVAGGGAPPGRCLVPGHASPGLFGLASPPERPHGHRALPPGLVGPGGRGGFGFVPRDAGRGQPTALTHAHVGRRWNEAWTPDDRKRLTF